MKMRKITETPSVLVILVVSFFTIIAIAGCTLGPDYNRPSLDVPESYHTSATETNDLTVTNSFADASWQQVMTDPQLQAYINEALTNSWDIKIAAARVLQAEAAARVTRSRYMPTVSAEAEWNKNGADGKEQDFQSVYGTMALYELDLWGNIRRANEAAIARLLATEAAQRTVRQTLVADVATAYLGLLELDHELEISQRTYDVRMKSLALTQSREEGGVTSMQDVYQAQILVATAEATIADTHRRIEQKENELSILLGRTPGSPLARGDGFLQQNLDVMVPPGLPSDLLDRRPDIRSAEEQLIAVNASIGQAKAAFFPNVTLTGLYGYQSVEFSDLFKSPSKVWQFGPSVSLPIFTGGALKGRLKFAKASFDEALAQYQKTVQNSFREVSDSLIAYQRTQEIRARQEKRTQANRSATALSNVRYEGGVTSYLEVLYNEQDLFTAELTLAQVRLNELLSVVALYRSLGGGWQAEPVFTE